MTDWSVLAMAPLESPQCARLIFTLPWGNDVKNTATNTVLPSGISSCLAMDMKSSSVFLKAA